jgi:ATP-dependent DNA ligase
MLIHFLQHKISFLPVAYIFITGMEPVEFHSVTRVGSGYSMYELSELLQKLSPHWQQVLPGQCPPGLAWTKEKPDVWIAPQNSYILEVNFSWASCCVI